MIDNFEAPIFNSPRYKELRDSGASILFALVLRVSTARIPDSFPTEVLVEQPRDIVNPTKCIVPGI